MTFFCPKTQLLAVVAIALTSSVSSTAAKSAGNEMISGPAQVIDGDSLMVAGREIRLHGLDVPEWDQTCTDGSGKEWKPGQQAKAWLASRITSHPLACTREDTDRHGRLIATCYLAGENINETLVRQGWAVAYRRYSDRYTQAEADARTAKRGLWSGPCDQPEHWRREKEK